jgi:hypothetical protein
MSDDEDYHDALSSCSWSSAVEQEQEDGPGAVLGQHGQGVEGIALRGRAHLALDHAVRLHQEGGLPVAPEKPPEADPHAHTCAGAVPAHKTMPAEKTAVDITAPYAADAQRLSSWGFAWACVEKAAHGAARAAAAARGSTPGIGSQNDARAPASFTWPQPLPLSAMVGCPSPPRPCPCVGPMFSLVCVSVHVGSHMHSHTCPRRRAPNAQAR